jgi:predicted site-specific integrase-resolvase
MESKGNKKTTVIKEVTSEEWLSEEEVCNILNISKPTLEKYRARGIIKFKKLNNKIYFKKKDIQSLKGRRNVTVNVESINLDEPKNAIRGLINSIVDTGMISYKDNLSQKEMSTYYGKIFKKTEEKFSFEEHKKDLEKEWEEESTAAKTKEYIHNLFNDILIKLKEKEKIEFLENIDALLSVFEEILITAKKMNKNK